MVPGNGNVAAQEASRDRKKPQIGLRRHFTRPGHHPYDEVEWERRDARIANHIDGSVVFEQTDVEFPPTGRSTPPTS